MRDETSVKRYLNQFDKEKIIELYIQQRFENKQNLWEKSKEIEQKDQRIAELEKLLAIREIAFFNEIPY